MSRNFELLQQADKRDVLVPAPIRSTVLDAPRTQHVRQPEAHHNQPMADADWLHLWTVLQKRWRTVAIFGASVIAVTILFTVLTRPTYEPAARLEIDPPGAELFSIEGRTGGTTDAEYLETQAKNLGSDELAISVIRQLRLDNEPDLVGGSMVYKVVGTPFRLIQGVSNRVWRKPGGKAAEAVSQWRLSPNEAKALDAFNSRLQINRDTASRLVSVSFASHDPALAAEVTNTLVSQFIDRTYETRHEAIMKSTEWLSRQLDDIRGRMQHSSQALADFQSTAGIADIDQNRSTFTEQMAELSRQKTQAQAERIQLQSYLNKARANNLDTLPQVQSNPLIQTLSQKLAEAKAEFSQTKAVYGINHPNVRKLQNQITELEAQLNLQRNAILAQLQTSYDAAATREQMMSGAIRGTTKELSQMAQYTALKKEADADSQLYNSLYARVKEAGIAAASTSSNIRVIDQARVLDRPTHPRPLVNLAVAFLIALVGGVMLVFIQEGVDTRLHTAEDVRRYTGVSSVSILPLVAPQIHLASGRAGLLFGRADNGLDGKPPKFVTDQPGSVQAEAMRSLYTTIMLSQPQQPRVLLVASSVPAEGKTTVAVNLALALCQQGRTCLVDADLRRPGLLRAFAVRVQAGLAEYLADSTPLEDTLIQVPGNPNLTLLPAGLSKTADPGMLISSDKMRALISILRQTFEYVIIDSPPVLPYADGRALSPFVDGVVFVGRAGVVTRAAMIRSMELLQEVHSAPILDTVLNAAEFDRHDYYRYYQRYN